jgi:hypothetical protein
MSVIRSHAGPVSWVLLARRLLSWRRLLLVSPGLFAVAYLIVLMADFHPVITSINMHGDVVIAPVLGKLAGEAPSGSRVLLGHHPWYEEFLFLRATSGLSFYRQLWEVSPLLWSLAGFVLLGWAAWRALGATAALLTTSALICLGDLGRFMFLTFNWHGLTVVHTIVIAAALVWLAPRAAGIGWFALCALAVLLGLVGALPMASDALFPFWALIPMCVVAGLMGYRNTGRARWTPVVFAVLTVAVSVVAGRVIDHVMRDSGVLTIPFPYTFVGSIKTAFNYLEQLLVGWMNLGGGGFFGRSVTLPGVAALLSGVLIAAGLVLGLWEVRRLAAGAWRTSRTGGSLVAAAEGRGPQASARMAYVSFWASSLLVQVVVFIGTSVPKTKTGSVRYALAGYVAIMALMPLLARRGPVWRWVVTAGVCVFALCSIFQLARRPYHPYGRYPGPPQARFVLRFARAHHVDRGYASYWDGQDLTWLTAFRLQIYPVRSGCGANDLCPDKARISSWYQPRPGMRSMLIADRAQAGVHAIPAQLGHPLATTRIGSLTLAVYRYDIASKL